MALLSQACLVAAPSVPRGEIGGPIEVTFHPAVHRGSTKVDEVSVRKVRLEAGSPVRVEIKTDMMGEPLKEEFEVPAREGIPTMEEMARLLTEYRAKNIVLWRLPLSRQVESAALLSGTSWSCYTPMEMSWTTGKGADGSPVVETRTAVLEWEPSPIAATRLGTGMTPELASALRVLGGLPRPAPQP